MKKNAKESFNMHSAIKCVAKMHFKDANQADQQSMPLFFKFYSPK